MQDSGRISIHVTPPDGEEDDEFMPPPAMLRSRRKLSSPLVALRPDGSLPTSKSLTNLDNNTRRRFSTMVSTAAAAAVSRRLSATIGWCLALPPQVNPQIVRQGRALCIQYIRSQIRRSSISSKKIILQRLKITLETECGEEALYNGESGVLAALKTLCGALERKKPEAFRQVARQATRAPAAMLRSETALSELALALARRICKDNITWAKVAAVYCVCGALAREAAEAAEIGKQQSVAGASSELVCAPAAALADLLHDDVGCWIASHGGWDGVASRLRSSERDQHTERTLAVMIGLFACACFVLVVVRVTLPNYLKPYL